jgi:hypothetical protein
MTFSVTAKHIYISVAMARGERLRAEITFSGGTQEENENDMSYAKELYIRLEGLYEVVNKIQ